MKCCATCAHAREPFYREIRNEYVGCSQVWYRYNEAELWGKMYSINYRSPEIEVLLGAIDTALPYGEKPTRQLTKFHIKHRIDWWYLMPPKDACCDLWEPKIMLAGRR